MLVFACHVNDSWTTNTLEFFFATVVIITKKLTDDLLTISVTFTWFYKTENIVMWQIEIDFGSHHTSWNIGLPILNILLFFKACLNSYVIK